MDSDNEYFYDEFMDSSSPGPDEDEDETTTMMAIFEEMGNAKEHVLNFKG